MEKKRSLREQETDNDFIAHFNQYIPLEGTAVYDGIKQAIGTFNL